MSGLELRQHPAPLEPGTVVSVGGPVDRVDDPMRRYGIVADRPDEYGLPIVLTLSERMGLVLEESWVGFTRAHPARVHAPGDAPRSEVYEAAKGLLYRPFRRAEVAPEGIVAMLGTGRMRGAPEAMAETGVVAGAPMLFVRTMGGTRAPAGRDRDSVAGC